jgi:hypothetical protein
MLKQTSKQDDDVKIMPLVKQTNKQTNKQHHALVETIKQTIKQTILIGRSWAGKTTSSVFYLVQ